MLFLLAIVSVQDINIPEMDGFQKDFTQHHCRFFLCKRTPFLQRMNPHSEYFVSSNLTYCFFWRFLLCALFLERWKVQVFRFIPKPLLLSSTIILCAKEHLFPIMHGFPFRFTKTSVASCSDSLCKRTLFLKKDGPFFKWFSSTPFWRLFIVGFITDFCCARGSLSLEFQCIWLFAQMWRFFFVWQRSVSSSNSNKTATFFESFFYFTLCASSFDDPPLFYTSKKDLSIV